MKKQLTKVLLAVMAVIVLASCGNSDEKQAKTATVSYLTAMKEADFIKAKEYATPETGKLLDFLSQLVGQDTSVVAKAREEAKNVKIEVTEVKIENDNANVTYISQDNNKKEEATTTEENKPETITLKKVEGKWLVHQPKEDNGANDTDATIIEEEEIVINDTLAN